MYRSTYLENGIRVITEHIPNVRSVSIGMLVDASPRVETAHQAGIAHLAEHMLFHGTSNRDAGEIAQFMDRSGGQIGAFTARDYTCFYATVLDDYHTYALDLLGDIFLNSTFPEYHLALEKKAIQRELETARDSPYHRVHDRLKSYCWSPHPLGRPVGGDNATVQHLTREDVIYFVHRHYLPDGLTIAAAGNLQHEDFVAHVRDAFWRMMGTRDDGNQPPAPTHNPGLCVEPMSVSQNYFALGLPAPAYAAADRYTLHLINKILGGGISSRLYTNLREARGLVYQISAEIHAYQDAGLMIIEGSCAPEQLEITLYQVLQECRRLAHGAKPVGAEELWKTRMQIRGQHLIESENTHTRMSRLANQCFYFGEPIPSASILADIDGVTTDHIADMASHWLTGALADATLAVVGPHLASDDRQHALTQLLRAAGD